MSSPLTRSATTLGLAGCLIAGLTACQPDTTTTNQVSTWSAASPVDHLVITGDVLDVQVTGGGSTAEVTQTLSYTSTPPQTSHEQKGGTLTLHSSCAGQSHCHVTYAMTLPASAAIEVQTGVGSVHLTRVSGRVAARIGTGDIKGSQLGSSQAEAHTDTGNVSLQFAAAGDTVTATSRVGSVDVSLAGGRSYAVDAKVRVGDTSVTVPQDSASPHKVTATTDVGSVHVRTA